MRDNAKWSARLGVLRPGVITRRQRVIAAAKARARLAKSGLAAPRDQRIRRRHIRRSLVIRGVDRIGAARLAAIAVVGKPRGGVQTHAWLTAVSAEWHANLRRAGICVEGA